MTTENVAQKMMEVNAHTRLVNHTNAIAHRLEQIAEDIRREADIFEKDIEGNHIVGVSQVQALVIQGIANVGLDNLPILANEVIEVLKMRS